VNLNHTIIHQIRVYQTSVTSLLENKIIYQKLSLADSR